jgi:hypothetical protein
MEIIFDDSFRFLSSIQNQQDETPTRVSSLGGIILEKSFRIAATNATVEQAIKDYKNSSDNATRNSIIVKIFNDKSLTDEDYKHFREAIENTNKSGGLSSGAASGNDPFGVMASEADLMGIPGAEVGTSLKLKEAVVARLRNRGLSDDQINDILVLFLEKLPLPFSETIKILDYCLQYAFKARSNVVDLIEFVAYHYRDKADLSYTKMILDEAVRLQEINPSINIFNLLKNAAIGNQAEIGKIILIKDPDARLIANNLISLTQSSLKPQDEQVRIMFQRSRDTLLAYQEKNRIQRALYDMMKTEEMNTSLTSLIANMSAIFKMALTQPLFRAIKDMYYDLQASKIVLNSLSAMMVDTQPLKNRVTPLEESDAPGSGFYDYNRLQRPQRITGSSTKFVSLKKNNIVTAQGITSIQPGVSNPISSQIAPPSNQKPSSAILGQPSTAPKLNQGTIGGVVPAAATLTELDRKIDTEITSLGSVFAIVGRVASEFVRSVIKRIMNGEEPFQVLDQEFQKAIAKFKNMGEEIRKNIESWGKNTFKDINKYIDNQNKYIQNTPQTISTARTVDKFIKTAQSNPQTSYEGFDKQKWSAGISTVVTVLLAALSAEPLLGLAARLKGVGDLTPVINAILPAFDALKNFVKEVVLEFNLGAKAPSSDLYYDPKTNQLTQEGLRRLYNNQQTRISLGITTEEYLALARAEKQRVENMATVKAKLDQLSRSLDQPVYLGGKTDTTPGGLPVEVQNKVNEFVKFVDTVLNACVAEYTLLKKAVDRVYNTLDPMQKIQAQNLFSDVRNDMSYLESLSAEYSNSAKVLENIQRSRKLKAKLGPAFKRMQALEALGISKAALLTGKNGILEQLARIRHEEALALQKLRKEYIEKYQILDRPDIAQTEFSFPVDTKATKLPLPPLPPKAPTSA